jgi:phosphoribosylanthranilate isomerase
MTLKTTVAVGNITNLSEARYCASMGVHYLCFPAHRVDPKTFREITGWITGPSFIIDISQVENGEIAMSNYAADNWLLNPEQYAHLNFPNGKTIFLDARNARSAGEIDAKQASFVVVHEGDLSVFPREMGEKLLVTGDTKSLISKIERDEVEGIWLEGSEEERPGLKDYSNLETMLEKLDLD